jgi:hypothetical protein
MKKIRKMPLTKQNVRKEWTSKMTNLSMMRWSKAVTMTLLNLQKLHLLNLLLLSL